MTDDSAQTEALTEPAIAAAEDGLVILDGPPGLMVTLTASAAAQTGRNLIDAAAMANDQLRTSSG